MVKGVREIELKVLSELMKNSRVSDRELAKRLGVSQPTVSRIRNKFEKEGYIKEYTYVPDFVKLGYNLMALTLIKRAEGSKEESSLFKEANKYAAKMGFDTVMAVRGMGFVERIREIKQFPGIDVEDVESFIVDLTDKELYRELTFSTLANHMLTLGKTQE
jgi:Lrp/AsnC family leucine-responsive transcriptional regulator